VLVYLRRSPISIVLACHNAGADITRSTE